MTMILESDEEKFVPEFTHKKYHVWVPEFLARPETADAIKKKIKAHFPKARFKLVEDDCVHHYWGDPDRAYQVTLNTWAEDAEFFFCCKSGVFDYNKDEGRK